MSRILSENIKTSTYLALYEQSPGCKHAIECGVGINNLETDDREVALRKVRAFLKGYHYEGMDEDDKILSASLLLVSQVEALDIGELTADDPVTLSRRRCLARKKELLAKTQKEIADLEAQIETADV